MSASAASADGNTFSVTAFPSPVSADTLALRIVKPSSDDDATTSGNDVHLMFALDKSGSMYGSGIKNAEKGLADIMTRVRNEVPDINITLVLFDHSTSVIRNPTTDNVRSIRAGGGTSFSSAFQAINNNMRDGASKTIVIFLTDGQDCQAKGATASFAKNMRAHPSDVVVHTIAFTPSADLQTCNACVAAGDEPGMVRYCRNAPDLPDIISSLMDYLSFDATCVMYAGKRITFDDDNVGYLVVPTDKIGSDITLDLAGQNSERTVTVPIKTTEEPNMEHIVEATIRHIMTDLKEWTRDLTSATSVRARKALLTEGQKIYKVHRDTVDAVRANIVRDRALRKMYSKFENVFVQFAEFGNMLAEAARAGLDNHRLGTLCHTASSMGTMKRGLARRVDDMVTRGADRFADIDKQAVAAGVNAKPHPDMVGIECPVTLQNTQEVLREGFAMCLLLDVSRPQSGAGVADPTRVRVRGIGPPISTDGFEQKLILDGDGNIKASDGLTYNAMLPVGCNGVTWLRAQMAVAHATTGNMFAFSWAQMAIYFIAYEYIMRRESTEHTRRLQRILHDTCVYVMCRLSPAVLPTDDDGNPTTTRMTDRVCEQFEAIVSGDMSKVTVDELPNVPMFWAQLRIMIDATGYEPSSGSLQRVADVLFEERVRRGLRNGGVSVADAYGYKHDIHVAPYVKQEKDKLRDTMSRNASNMDYSSFLNDTTTTAASSSSSGGKQVGNTNANDIIVGDMVSKIRETLMTETAAHYRAFTTSTLFPDVRVSDMTPEQWFCMLHQAATDGGDNTKRRERFASGTHYDPFNLDRARAYVVDTFRAYVADKRRSELAAFASSLSSNNDAKLVALFLNADDAAQAAGMLVFYNMMQGATTFQRMYLDLIDNGISKTPLFFEKMAMLITGRYNGTYVLRDTDCDDNVIGLKWRISRRNRMRLLRETFVGNNKEDWTKHIDKWRPYFKMPRDEAEHDTIDAWCDAIIASRCPV